MDKDIIKQFDNWLKENTSLKRNSRKQYVLQVKKFLNTIGNEVNKDNVIKFLRAGDRVYARRFALKKFCKFTGNDHLLVEIESVKKDLKLKERRHERFIDFNSFRSLLEQLSDDLQLGLMILYDTGMRVSSIINMKAKDVKHDNSGVYIIALEKGSKLVNRYLDNFTSQQLVQAIEGKDYSDYVFRQLKDNGAYETWWECYYRLWKELKSKSREFLGKGFGISFHWVRTSRAIELYEKYKDLVKVRNMLGHKSIETTLRYIEQGRFDSLDIIKAEEGKYESDGRA